MAGGSLFTVRFRSDEMATGVRDVAGRFTSFQREMRQAHERMAINASNKIRETLQEKINQHGRPQVARTHRGQGDEALLRAIVDPGNRTFGYGGFTVMDPDYMTRSVVGEYYRGLEVGSDRFVGRQFTGYFIMPGISYASRERSRTQAVMVIRGPGGESNRPGGNERVRAVTGDQQGFAGGAYGTRRGETATNAIPAQSLFTPLHRREGRAGMGHLITIENPIPAYHYIEEGFADWVASDDLQKQVQTAAKDAGLQMEGNRVIVPPMFRR